jgi:hypothetical protein
LHRSKPVIFSDDGSNSTDADMRSVAQAKRSAISRKAANTCWDSAGARAGGGETGVLHVKRRRYGTFRFQP